MLFAPRLSQAILRPSFQRRPESRFLKNTVEKIAENKMECRPKIILDSLGDRHHRFHYHLLLAIVAAVAYSCTTIVPEQVAKKSNATLALTPCTLPKHQEAARCGKLTVYENRMARSGRQISLNIVVLPARNSQAAADPVFYLAGGPGQAAARIASAGEDTIMRELRQERDLVFVDMRGTGESNGLQCDSAVNRNETQSFFREIFDPTVIKACREKLEQSADLKLYNTSLGIDDLDDIRVVLGYDKINLYGISNGSQAALEYLRRYANHARVAALAGVVTSAAKVPLQFARGATQAITRLFSDCASDEACNSAFANLETKFAQLLRSFDNGAVTIQALHPTSKAIQMVPLSRGVFTALLLSLLYNHRTLSLLPLIIDRAARGDWRPYAQVVSGTAAPPEFRVDLGAYLSATCSESLPFIDETELAHTTAGTFMGDYRTRRHRQACVHWPHRAIDAEYIQPVRVATPVLMLSGDIDPATPPEFGAQALKTLPNGQQVILRNTPHSYSASCARQLIVAFISSGSARELDTSCAARQRRPPFATELPASYNR
jgi:pimeloyl-ACP methyl ester carboxylesterase